MQLGSTIEASVKPIGNNLPGQFRHDINGLRAIAVLGVLLFHFKVPGFSGGFAGVDVFFVISGYLMTQIIIGRPRALGAFYLARAERLIPALAVMISITMLCGLLFIDPVTLAKMAKEAVAALVFVSNFYYLFQGDYFAPAAEANWFLHNWSLSLEWQFFVLYPVAIALVRKVRETWIAPAIALMFAISLFMAVGLPLLRPWTTSLTFYMLPTRLWELLAGGLIYLYSIDLKARVARFLHYAGLALIAVSFGVFDGSMAWPFYWALVPVAGTMLVIAAHHEASWTKAAKKIGLASYSTYLWHWPIIVAFVYLGVELTTWQNLALVILSLVIGSISFRYIEKGLRSRSSKRNGWWKVGWASAVPLLAGMVLITTTGLESVRFSSMNRQAQTAAIDLRQALDDWSYDDLCSDNPCSIGTPANTLVIGDSHAQMYAPLLLGEPVDLYTAEGCLPLPGLERTKPSFRCGEKISKAFDLAASDEYDRIVLIASWSDLFNPDDHDLPSICGLQQGDCVVIRDAASLNALKQASFVNLEEEVRKLETAGKSVAIMLLSPVSNLADSKLNYRKLFQTGDYPKTFGKEDFLDATAKERNLLQALAERQGAELIDPVDAICKRDCPIEFGGQTLYIDTNHFRSSRLNESLFDFFKPAVLGRQQ